MLNRSEELLIQLFENWAGESGSTIHPLPLSGSNRTYYRIKGKKISAIGVHNPDRKENNAFVSFSKHFRSSGLPVPEIYAYDENQYIYLEQDLGDITLFSYLTEQRSGEEFPSEVTGIYKQVLEELVRFQIEGGKRIDYSMCYPRGKFDKQSMLWDMHYFKYYFLKLAQIPFDEQTLEDDFDTFSDYLLQADKDFFLYRDFQSRNVMLMDKRPFFIDYQGGRKGALQYDLASLLYDAKADIPEEIRNELLGHYLEILDKQISFDPKEFTSHYHGYVVIRIMQALGAYGFRGFYERKEHFLQSIPFAIENLKNLLQKVTFPVEVPSLMNAFEELTKSEKLKKISGRKKELVVTVNSFSYREGIPPDYSGNGGGFVFDCRALPNPGRLTEFQDLSGKDRAVRDFLSSKPAVEDFLRHSFSLVDQAVTNYIERNFTRLSVSFGCTGGRHRSVYAAEELAEYLRDKYKIRVEVHHTEEE
ncbi:MAG: phosphotransferase [Bacteroidales bacterium]|nr:MAG: phosphotransferase [Bacteroidales bacterium]